MNRGDRSTHLRTLTSSTNCWRVYERTDRWIDAVRRFVPHWLDESKRLSIVALGNVTSDTVEQLRRRRVDGAAGRVVLWQIDRDNFQYAASAIALSSISFPSDLQIAAVDRVSPTSQMALSELGIATIIRHPEQLPGLKRMILRHFSR